MVNFSDQHDYYKSAYQYVCKEDNEVVHSEGHPKDLLSKSSPRTKKSIAAFRASCRKRRSTTNPDEGSSTTPPNNKPKSYRRRMSNMEVSDFVRRENIKTYTELLAAAEARRMMDKMI